MNCNRTVLAITATVVVMFAAHVPAADMNTGTPGATVNSPSQIYGAQLMTPEERSAFRAKMRSLKTAGERQKLRLEHHQEMQARAQEKGITLPEAPPMGHKGMGGGAGMMQPGQGMKPGQTIAPPPPAATP